MFKNLFAVDFCVLGLGSLSILEEAGNKSELVQQGLNVFLCGSLLHVHSLGKAVARAGNV